MKALWLANQTLQFRDEVPVPQPADHEALIRVLQAGICNTDLEMVRGYYPFEGVPGHEFVGLVDQGPSHLVGQRVVGEINIACHDCAACARGHTSHCEQRSVLGIKNRHGAFAEYLTLPVANLHTVPDEIGLDAATFAEPLAAAMEIQQQVSIDAADRVLVVGSGKLGQLIIQTLALTGCRLHVVGRQAREIGLADDRTIGVETAAEISPRSFDIAIECTGNSEGFEIARRALRPRGQMVMKSTYVGRLEIDAAALVVDEITLIGSRCGPFPEALRLLAEKRVEVAPLIGARFPLHRGLDAFREAGRPASCKILLQIGESERSEC